jgi:flagellar hook-associated protein 1
MSLGLAYEIARGSLAANSISSSVISRNIANVDNPNAARKTAIISTNSGGGVRVDGIGNAVDAALFESVLGSSSKENELKTISAALNRLEASVNDPQLGLSPNALLSQMQSALQAAAAAPHDDNLARNVLSAATSVANGLNAAGNLVDKIRSDANRDLLNGANQLTGLLARFETANNDITSGTTLGRDVTERIDERNGLLRDIAGLVDVHSSVRGNNDMVLFVTNGTTLFETVPRKISVDASAGLSPGQPGGALSIDGIPFSGAQGSRLGGKLGGALQVRDVLTVTFGQQLDELARGVIEAFSESDQSAVPVGPDLAGLFTYPGDPSLPASGIVANGLARTIKVNSNVDPVQGGNLALLRDGGISDPNYNYNPTGGTGFSDRLRELGAALSQSRSFDPLAGIGTSKGLLGFAADSAGWLENARSVNSELVQQKQVLSERATGAWQSSVGINLDEELTLLMSLEKSFQASSRLINTVNTMFDALLQIAR